MYNKRTKNWFAVAVKEPKQYDYIGELQDLILSKRAEVNGSSKQKIQLDPADPKHISKTLAPIDPPPMDVLIERHKSRFNLP